MMPLILRSYIKDIASSFYIKSAFIKKELREVFILEMKKK